jgi:hypothetical protein
MPKQWEDPEELEDPEDKPPMEETTSTPTIRASARTNTGIGPRRLVDKQRYAAFANVAKAEEAKPRTLSEALNHSSWGEQWNAAVREEY